MNFRVTFHSRTIKALEKYLDISISIGDRHIIERIQAFLMIHFQISFEKICKILHKSKRTLYRWLAAFWSQGFDSFRRKKSPGRPVKLTKTKGYSRCRL